MNIFFVNSGKNKHYLFDAQIFLSHPSPSRRHPNHHRRAEYWRYGVQWQLSQRRETGANDIAAQCHNRAAEHCGRHQAAMVGGFQQQPRDVRHRQSDERHGAAIRRYNCRQNSRCEQQEKSAFLDIDANRCGVIFAQEKGVKFFRH